ncbi:MAG: hypothetical protein U5K69_06555 [Balneolaceae bacterium]|nr:hypothetical protein [Balneolaceae bacterium]
MIDRMTTGTLFFLIGAVFISCQQVGQRSPAALKVEYLTNPTGLDIQKPRFSWILNDSTRGASQTAYRLILSTNREEIENDSGSTWDTGKIASSRNVNVEYDGEPLESGQTYFWRIRTWNEDSTQTEWSPTQTFQMGLLNPNDWQAKWITTPNSTVAAPLFRHEFSDRKGDGRRSSLCNGSGIL